MATKKTTPIKKSSSTFTGSNSTGVIDVINVYGKSNTIKARNGNDKITVYEGTGHKIYGDAGVDTIVVKKGSSHRIYGGTGNDKITVSGGSKNLIYGESGADTFTIASTVGTGNKVYGGTGVDTFTIKGGSSNYYYGGDSGDKFSISGGKNNILSGQAGNDTFTIASTVGTGNKVYGGAGVDTFTIKGGSSNNYYGGDGGDKFTLSGGIQYVDGGAGVDKITVSGGNKHTLRGGKGSDTYTVSSAISKATRLTVNQADKASGDRDTLVLKKANNANIKYSYNSSKNTLTMTHSTGGIISVTNWTKNPLNQVQFQNGEKLHIIAGNSSTTLSGTSGNDYMIANSSNKTINAGAGNDTIRISGGSGQKIDTGTGTDKVYVSSGSVKSIVNAGGTDYIEIGKSAGNGIIVQSGQGDGKLVAKETVKILGGSKHDIRLYGGNDKVTVAGGSNHVIYTDGPTGSGDTGDNDVIVIQSGGQAKSIVAGNGNDVIAIANGAGNGSTIYTGLENPNNVNTGTGVNTVNILGGRDHIIYLGGTENKVLIEAQNITLNKYAGTADDIRVRWSEQGTDTLRINCPSVSSSKESTLRIEGAYSWDFEFYKQSVDIKNANGEVSETVDALVMKFVGQYNRDTRTISGNYQWNGDNEGNTRLPVYVNGNGLIQYNWCAGNQQISYNPTPVATGGSIEITRWFVPSLRVFDSITFDDKEVGYADIITASGKANHSLYNG